MQLFIDVDSPFFFYKTLIETLATKCIILVLKGKIEETPALKNQICCEANLRQTEGRKQGNIKKKHYKKKTIGHLWQLHTPL